MRGTEYQRRPDEKREVKEMELADSSAESSTTLSIATSTDRSR